MSIKNLFVGFDVSVLDSEHFDHGTTVWWRRKGYDSPVVHAALKAGVSESLDDDQIGSDGEGSCIAEWARREASDKVLECFIVVYTSTNAFTDLPPDVRFKIALAAAEKLEAISIEKLANALAPGGVLRCSRGRL